MNFNYTRISCRQCGSDCMEELHGNDLAAIAAQLTMLPKTTKYRAYQCVTCSAPAVYANSTQGLQ